MSTKAFLDANVFVQLWTLDPILCLAEHGCCEAYWSEHVIEESNRAVEAVHEGFAELSKQSFQDACRAFPDALVTGYEHCIPSLRLPDADDRHVLAAALEAGCDVIVTYNLRDFPEEVLEPLRIRAIHPDDFLMELAEEDGQLVRTVMQELVASKLYPPRTMAEELVGLKRNRLIRFAEFLEA